MSIEPIPAVAAVAARPVNDVRQPGVTAPPAVEDPAQQLGDRLDSAVRTANEQMQGTSQSIRFRLDEESGRILVRVIDDYTQEVLRQIPSKEMLAIAKSLDRLQGLILSQRA